MSAYLFTGLASRLYRGNLVDSCSSLIIYGGDEEASRWAFEAWLRRPDTSEEPGPTEIESMVGAPVLDQLLTEAGCTSLDWPKICEEAEQITQATQPDELGQGYWADCDRLVRPKELSPNVEWLERELPEEVRAGLNWSGDRTFFFVVSVLSPPAPRAEAIEELTDEAEHEGNFDRSEQEGLAARLAAFPELEDRALVVLVRARNAIIAAWLWRKHAVTTHVAAERIRIDPWCGALALEPREGAGSMSKMETPSTSAG